MTTAAPNIQVLIEGKIKKINDELSLPWGERLEHALFDDEETQKQLARLKQEKQRREQQKLVKAAAAAAAAAAAQHATQPAATTAPDATPAATASSDKELVPSSAETPPGDAPAVEKSDDKPAVEVTPPAQEAEAKPAEPAPEVKHAHTTSDEDAADAAELEELRQREEIYFEKRPITVEFDWGSFSDLFTSLINEGAAEVIDTILDSLISKDCAVSLLSSLLEHCKATPGVRTLTKREQIRSFLQQGLKKYIIKYSDDPREWGYFKDGVLCDVVEIDVTDNEEINWIFRDVTQNIENCTELQQFITSKYYIPMYRWKIRQSMHKDIRLLVDWQSIDYAAQDYSKAVYAIFHENSAFVLDELYRAFEAIAVYEPDDLVDAIAAGIKRVVIALQPGQDSTRKDFDIDDKSKTLTLRLCLEADEFAGVFRHRDLIPIIKLAGLFDTSYSKVFKNELLSAAAQIFKVPRGDLGIFKQILSRKNYFVDPVEKELVAIETCKKYIDKYYKEKLQGWSSSDGVGGPGGQNGNRDEEDDEEEDEEYEKLIKGWHVIKFNKLNMHQERYVVLTNKAYWTFKFDPHTGKVDEKHFKRHDLLDFCVVDIGVLEQTEAVTVEALKVFTREKRKPNMFGQKYQEVAAVDGKGKKKISMELRKSLKIKATTAEDLKIFQNMRNLGNLEETVYKPRQKRVKPPRERPPTEDCYSSVFIPHGEHSPEEFKDILIEIAWCLYAASVSRQRARGAEPFLGQNLTRPKSTLQSFFYNTLSLGMARRGSVAANKAKQGSPQFAGSPGQRGSGGQPGSGTSSPVLANKSGKVKIGESIASGTADDSPSSSQITKFSPNMNGNKQTKPILKRIGENPGADTQDNQDPQAETPVEDPAQDDADALLVKASHNRRVIFRPEVQVFYHDVGDEDDGDFDDDQQGY